MFIDLDRFKAVNDTYGHQLGDQVLRLVGKALYDSVKGKDTAARYGGEEFAIILPDTTSGGATAVAENIRKTVASKRLQKKGSDDALGAVTMSLTVFERIFPMVLMVWRMVLFSRNLLFRQYGMAALSPRYGVMKGMASAVSVSPRPLSVNMMVRPKNSIISGNWLRTVPLRYG